MPLRSATHFSEDLPVVGHSFHPDRRKRARVRVQWRLIFRGPGAAVEAVTDDLSSEGFYCLASTPFIPGEVRTCTLSVPANDPDDLCLAIPVQCRVRVVRVEALAEKGLFGVGCRIDDYWVHPPATAGAAPVRAYESGPENHNSNGHT